MKDRIRYSLIYMGVIAALCAVYFTMQVFEGEMAGQLKSQLRENLRLIETAYVGEALGDEPQKLSKFASKDLRITLIDSKGGILYDSDAETVKMENHNDREEVIDAFAKGAGEDLRYSSTLQAKVFYFAKRLNDGKVLRLGMRQANLQQVFSKTIPYLIVLLAAIVAAAILIAFGLSRAFISPLQKLVDQLGTPEWMKIENDMAKPEDVKMFAGKIHKEALRLQSIANDIITLSKLDGQQGELFDLNEKVNLWNVAHGCVEDLSLKKKKKSVSVSLDGDKAAEIQGNSKLLYEMVFNLVDNSIRYTEQGGKVAVVVEPGAIVVKDTGIGIPEECRSRVFERFYRVDKSRSKATGGTGLGLAIVKHIAEVLHATIQLNSAVGFGTEIRIGFKV